MTRCFGDDWSDYGYVQYDHRYEKPLEKIKVKLTDDNKKPAEKTGPIRK